jgi:2-aminoadipate transaminase
MMDRTRNPIRFTVGNVDPETLPLEALRSAFDKLIARPAAAFDYSPADGDVELRRQLASRTAREANVELSERNVTLTSGTSQSLQVACQAFLRPGDMAVTETPAWSGFVRAARSVGAEVVPVCLDDEGPRLDELRRVVSGVGTGGIKPKVLYVIPSYRNPTGTTMSVGRREEILNVARANGVLVVEDHAYAALSYTSDTPPSLFALAHGVGVIQIGTFSKTIATGLRLGWIVAAEEVIDRLRAWRFDNGTSSFVARMVTELVIGGDYDEHVKRMRSLYRRKWELLEDVLSSHFSAACAWTTPAGGFITWLTWPDGVDTPTLLADAEHAGVAAASGLSFFLDGRGRSNVRLCFSAVPLGSIREGAQLLAASLRHHGRE